MPNQCSPRTQRVSENHGLCKPERATSTCIGGNVTLRMTPFLHLIWFDDSRSEFWFPNHSDPRCPRARNPGPDSPYCIQQCVCVCACMHACMCVWICIYVNIYTNTHTHTHTHTYIHTCVCVCVCVYLSFVYSYFTAATACILPWQHLPELLSRDRGLGAPACTRSFRSSHLALG